jgi:hypothetical protein
MYQVKRTSSTFLSKILDGIKYIQSLFVSAWNNLIGFFRNLFSASSAHESSRAPNASTPVTTLGSKSEILQALADQTPQNIVPGVLNEASQEQAQSQLILRANLNITQDLTPVAPNHWSNLLCYSGNYQKQLMVGFILSFIITYWALSGSEASDTRSLQYPL